MSPKLAAPEQLVRSLAEIAVELQRARSVDAVVRAAVRGLTQLGVHLAVMGVEGDHSWIRYVELGPDSPLNLIGHASPLGRSGPVVPGSPLHTALTERRAVYTEEAGKWSAAFWASALPKDAAKVKAFENHPTFSRCIIAPVFVRNERWGALVLISRVLALADLPAWGLFTSQFSSAVEVADTIERLERRNRELEAIRGLVSAGPAEHFDSLVAELLATAARAVSSDGAVLYRLDAERKELVMVGLPFGYEGPLVERFRRLKTPAAPRWSGDSTAQAFDVNTFPFGNNVSATGFKQFVAVPLNVAGQVLGVVILARRLDQPYEAHEVHTAEVLGEQVSTQVQRAQLLEEASRRVRHLTALNELAKAGSGATEMGSVIHRVLEQLQTALATDSVTVHFLAGNRLELAGKQVRSDPTGARWWGKSEEYIPFDETSLVGLAAVRGTSQVATAADAPLLTAEEAKVRGFKHMIATPLVVGGRLLGTVSAARRGDEPFTDEDVMLSQSLSAHFAIVVDQVRLVEDLRNSYDALAATQAEMVRRERLVALGEVAAVMAHEVRNPLGAIFNALASLKRTVKPNGDGAFLLEILQEEADRLDRIVGDLLDLARPFEAQLRPVNIQTLVAAAVDAALAHGDSTPHVKVVTALERENMPFLLDAQLMRQALLNLLLNAVQAMPQGGTITVRATVNVGLEAGSRRTLTLDIEDQGIGLPVEVRRKIFQPFFTTKAKGTGLGLAVVKRIVDAHHGDIRVASGPEKGTVFSLVIPEDPLGDADGDTAQASTA
ncbi:MAG: GAF domain-containing protein [Myxococcaceae bacterium]|nr:GAF domain-containing protein [Myxococcaceae bacterium]